MASLRGRSWSQFASIPVLLVVLALFWLWFRSYERRESAYLRARNLRLIDEVAVHVEKTLTATDSALRRMAESVGNDAILEVDPKDAPLVARLRALFHGASFRAINVRFSRPPAAGGGPAAPEDRMRLVPDHAPQYVEFDHQVRRPERAPEVEVISVQTDLSQLLRGEMAGDSDGQPVFSDLLIVAPDGVVVSQRDAPVGRLVRSPPELFKADGAGFERLLERPLFGEPFYVFRQLVRLPNLERQGQRIPELTLCGLVPVARFRAVARSFSSSVQLLLLLAVVLAALAWAFLRVLFSGVEEPLRPRHLGFVTVAGIAVVAIWTLVVVDVVLYRIRLARATDDELVHLAGEVRGRFVRELDQARQAIDGLPPGALQPDGRSHGRMFSDGRFAPLEAAYPFVDDVVLIGPGDSQLSKWSRDRFSTPLYNVGGRAYVRDLREGRPWTLPGGELVAENVRRFSSGSKQTVLSTFAGGEKDLGADLQSLSIRALAAEMISVSAPILPAGYAFALFRDSGAVVYHSMPEKSIDENIDQELRDPRPFHAAAPAGPFDAQYEGRDHRAYVTAVAGTPLTLAVLRDRIGPRTFNLRFVTRTVVAGTMLFLLECALLVFTWRRSPARTAWCWPNPARFGRLLLAFVCAAALVGVGALGRWLLPAQALPVALLAAALAVVACWYVLDRLPRSALDDGLERGAAMRLPFVRRAARALLARVERGATTETTKLTYVGLLTALLTLLAVLPTLALADLAYRWSLEQDLDGELTNVQRRWEARERSITDSYARSSPEIAVRRRADRRDFYPSTELAVSVVAECPEAAGGGARGPWATEGLLSTADAISSTLAIPRSAVTSAHSWRGSYAGALVCAASGPETAATAVPRTFVRGETRPGAPLAGWRPWGVGIAVLFWICWWAVGAFRKRVYGFLDEPPAARERPADGATPGEQWDRCSAEEQDVLARVARGELVPRHYEEAARRLVEAGLIQLRPLPRHVLPELARFSRSAPPPPAPPPARAHLVSWRLALSVALLAAAVFIYFTQESGSMAFLTGVTAILPLLARITDTLTGGGSARS